MPCLGARLHCAVVISCCWWLLPMSPMSHGSLSLVVVFCRLCGAAMPTHPVHEARRLKFTSDFTPCMGGGVPIGPMRGKIMPGNGTADRRWALNATTDDGCPVVVASLNTLASLGGNEALACLDFHDALGTAQHRPLISTTAAPPPPLAPPQHQAFALPPPSRHHAETTSRNHKHTPLLT